ncbi:MAG: hypothetical protein ACFFBD_15520, partial [Candidatus Hodarchaeota archaeon]
MGTVSEKTKCNFHITITNFSLGRISKKEEKKTFCLGRTQKSEQRSQRLKSSEILNFFRNYKLVTSIDESIESTDVREFSLRQN